MKKKLTIVLVLLAVVLLAGIVGTTYAWLTDQKAATNTYTIGDVTYDVTFGATSDGVVVPGQPLFDATGFVITNKSNVASNIRVKYSVSEVGVNGAVACGTNAATDVILLTLATGWVLDGEYVYYGTEAAPTIIPAATNTTEGVALTADPLSGMAFNGAIVGNTFSGKVYTVAITVQAKQADYVTWADLASFSFETGLTA